MSGEFESSKDLQSTKFEWRPQIFVKLSFTGFDSMTQDSIFTVLVEVFKNHILAENTFYKSYRVNRTQEYGLKTCK